MPKIIDYYYRAVHDVTIAAKLLVKSYYHTETIRRSYFDGCSNGGKMGLDRSIRFPTDYDGIIAGSPWLDPVGTSLWSVKNIKALLDAYIPPAKFEAVAAAILKQCDKADGVADGLIQNPAKCTFDPERAGSRNAHAGAGQCLENNHEPGARRARQAHLSWRVGGKSGPGKYHRSRRDKLSRSSAVGSKLREAVGRHRCIPPTGRSRKIF